MRFRVVRDGSATTTATEGLPAHPADGHTSTAPLDTAMPSPTADPVSPRRTASTSVHRGKHAAVADQGLEQLDRLGAREAQSSKTGSTKDARATAAHGGVR